MPRRPEDVPQYDERLAQLLPYSFNLFLCPRPFRIGQPDRRQPALYVQPRTLKVMVDVVAAALSGPLLPGIPVLRRALDAQQVAFYAFDQLDNLIVILLQLAPVGVHLLAVRGYERHLLNHQVIYAWIVLEYPLAVLADVVRYVPTLIVIMLYEWSHHQVIAYGPVPDQQNLLASVCRLRSRYGKLPRCARQPLYDGKRPHSEPLVSVRLPQRLDRFFRDRRGYYHSTIGKKRKHQRELLLGYLVHADAFKTAFLEPQELRQLDLQGTLADRTTLPRVHDGRSKVSVQPVVKIRFNHR